MLGGVSPAPLRPAAGSICSWGWRRDLWPESSIRGPLLLLHGSWCEWQWKNKPFFSLTSGKMLPPPYTHPSGLPCWLQFSDLWYQPQDLRFLFAKICLFTWEPLNLHNISKLLGIQVSSFQGT